MARYKGLRPKRLPSPYRAQTAAKRQGASAGRAAATKPTATSRQTNYKNNSNGSTPTAAQKSRIQNSPAGASRSGAGQSLFGWRLLGRRPPHAERQPLPQCAQPATPAWVTEAVSVTTVASTIRRHSSTTLLTWGAHRCAHQLHACCARSLPLLLPICVPHADLHVSSVRILLALAVHTPCTAVRHLRAKEPNTDYYYDSKTKKWMKRAQGAGDGPPGAGGSGGADDGGDAARKQRAPIERPV